MSGWWGSRVPEQRGRSLFSSTLSAATGKGEGDNDNKLLGGSETCERPNRVIGRPGPPGPGLGSRRCARLWDVGGEPPKHGCHDAAVLHEGVGPSHFDEWYKEWKYDSKLTLANDAHVKWRPSPTGFVLHDFVESTGPLFASSTIE
jgi:hypothetical protein